MSSAGNVAPGQVGFSRVPCATVSEGYTGDNLNARIFPQLLGAVNGHHADGLCCRLRCLRIDSSLMATQIAFMGLNVSSPSSATLKLAVPVANCGLVFQIIKYFRSCVFVLMSLIATKSFSGLKFKALRPGSDSSHTSRHQYGML